MLRARERDHEAVALVLDLYPAVARHLLSHDSLVRAQYTLRTIFAEALGHRREALDVREQDRDRAVGARVPAEVGRVQPYEVGDGVNGRAHVGTDRAVRPEPQRQRLLEERPRAELTRGLKRAR